MLTEAYEIRSNVQGTETALFRFLLKQGKVRAVLGLSWRNFELTTYLVVGNQNFVVDFKTTVCMLSHNQHPLAS